VFLRPRNNQKSVSTSTYRQLILFLSAEYRFFSKIKNKSYYYVKNEFLNNYPPKAVRSTLSEAKLGAAQAVLEFGYIRIREK
jgi:hypothetical protein